MKPLTNKELREEIKALKGRIEKLKETIETDIDMQKAINSKIICELKPVNDIFNELSKNLNSLFMKKYGISQFTQLEFWTGNYSSFHKLLLEIKEELTPIIREYICNKIVFPLKEASDQ